MGKGVMFYINRNIFYFSFIVCLLVCYIWREILYNYLYFVIIFKLFLYNFERFKFCFLLILCKFYYLYVLEIDIRGRIEVGFLIFCNIIFIFNNDKNNIIISSIYRMFFMC